MLDVLNWAKQRVGEHGGQALARFGLKRQGYTLVTIHRSENTDDLQRLSGILSALNALDEPVVFPVHPRTCKVMSEAGYRVESHVKVVSPLGYLEMVEVAGAARMILTDSGGLQKEAYWLGVPCLTMRDQTEWVETVETGWNMLVGTDPERIASAVRTFAPNGTRPALYGDGCAARHSVDLLRNFERM
jgi:UDP-N-acetylglucosamine 2-epimerase